MKQSWHALPLLATVLLGSSAGAEGLVEDLLVRCKVWSAVEGAGEQVVAWYGPCVGGMAQGEGVTRWYVDGNLAQTALTGGGTRGGSTPKRG